MRTNLLLLSLAATWFFGSRRLGAQATLGAGVLVGIVRDESGAPLSGVRISYDRVYASVGPVRNPRPAPGELIARGVVASDAAGSFQIPNLPNGRFRICATVPAAPFLDPCKWQAAKVAAVDGNATAPVSVTLTRGVFLKVRINDPEGLLGAVKESPFSAGGLIVGVKFGTGAFLGSEELSTFSGGRDYRMVMPSDLPCFLYLFSRHVTLTDGAGTKMNMSGGLIPFQAKAGVDQTFTFTVAGPLSP